MLLQITSYCCDDQIPRLVRQNKNGIYLFFIAHSTVIHLCKDDDGTDKFVNYFVFDMQMVSMVAKMELDTPSQRQSQLLQKQFSQLVEQILHVSMCMCVCVCVCVLCVCVCVCVCCVCVCVCCVYILYIHIFLTFHSYCIIIHICMSVSVHVRVYIDVCTDNFFTSLRNMVVNPSLLK